MKILPIVTFLGAFTAIYPQMGHCQNEDSPKPLPKALKEDRPQPKKVQLYPPASPAQFSQKSPGSLGAHQGSCTTMNPTLLGSNRNTVQDFFELPNEKLNLRPNYDLSAEAFCSEQTCTEAYCQRFYSEGEIDWQLLESELIKESKEASKSHDMIAEYAAWMGRRNCGTKILCDKNGTIRAAAVYEETGDELSLYALWGHPRFRGGGTLILKILQEMAIERGLEVIALDDMAGSATGFFSKMGFREMKRGTVMRTVLQLRKPEKELNQKRTHNFKTTETEFLEAPYKKEKLDPSSKKNASTAATPGLKVKESL